MRVLLVVQIGVGFYLAAWLIKSWPAKFEIRHCLHIRVSTKSWWKHSFWAQKNFGAKNARRNEAIR